MPSQWAFHRTVLGCCEITLSKFIVIKVSYNKNSKGTKILTRPQKE